MTNILTETPLRQKALPCDFNKTCGIYLLLVNINQTFKNCQGISIAWRKKLNNNFTSQNSYLYRMKYGYIVPILRWGKFFFNPVYVYGKTMGYFSKKKLALNHHWSMHPFPHYNIRMNGVKKEKNSSIHGTFLWSYDLWREKNTPLPGSQQT